MYPGETFHVSVVAVGQRNGIVPAKVRGRLTYSHSDTSIGDVGNLHSLQYLQATFNTCTILNYTVFSLVDRSGDLSLKLYTDGHCSSNVLALKLNLDWTCPPGFNLSEIARTIMCLQPKACQIHK